MDELLYKVQTRFLFRTNIKIKIPSTCKDSVFNELFGLLEEANRNYNSYCPDSFIAKINRHAGRFVDVSPGTIKILRQNIELSHFFNGSYDITIMPLIRLWGFYRQRHQTPSLKEIEKVKPLIDYKKIEISGNRVKIGRKQEIITGSFVKAYGVGLVVERMKNMGIDDAIINAGGSTIAALNNSRHPSWQVIVKDPVTKMPLSTFHLSNECYSTSAQNNIYVDIGGKHYGHILNPHTGFPSRNRMVGIVTNDCFTGDMLSTAMFNETSTGFIEKTETLSKRFPIEGIIVNENGMASYIKMFRKNVIQKI